jgi:hypothetical protein
MEKLIYSIGVALGVAMIILPPIDILTSVIGGGFALLCLVCLKRRRYYA